MYIFLNDSTLQNPFFVKKGPKRKVGAPRHPPPPTSYVVVKSASS